MLVINMIKYLFASTDRLKSKLQITIKDFTPEGAEHAFLKKKYKFTTQLHLAISIILKGKGKYSFKILKWTLN